LRTKDRKPAKEARDVTDIPTVVVQQQANTVGVYGHPGTRSADARKLDDNLVGKYCPVVSLRREFRRPAAPKRLSTPTVGTKGPTA